MFGLRKGIDPRNFPGNPAKPSKATPPPPKPKGK